MTKVMTPQGIERETDDLFYWNGPREYTEEQKFEMMWELAMRPEEFRNKKEGKRYAAWLKKQGYEFPPKAE